MNRGIVFIAAGLGAIIFFVFLLLVYTGVIKNPIPGGKQANLKTFYENPFDEKSQYINPLDEYKNPFDVIRADEQNQ